MRGIRSLPLLVLPEVFGTQWGWCCCIYCQWPRGWAKFSPQQVKHYESNWSTASASFSSVFSVAFSRVVCRDVLHVRRSARTQMEDC